MTPQTHPKADEEGWIAHVVWRIGDLTIKDGAVWRCERVFDPDTEICPICAEPFVWSSLCAIDVEMGTCHAACLAGSPVVDLDSGEPVPTGTLMTFRWGSGEAIPNACICVARDGPEGCGLCNETGVSRPAPASPDEVGRLRSEAAFLLDRLSEFESHDLGHDAFRDWQGHVSPSIARLRALLTQDHSEGGAS